MCSPKICLKSCMMRGWVIFLVQHIIIPHSELVNVVGDIFFYKYLINLLMFTF